MIHLNEFQTFLLLSILKVQVVLVITLTAVAYTVLLERKVLGRIQNRWGPSRVGPFGSDAFYGLDGKPVSHAGQLSMVAVRRNSTSAFRLRLKYLWEISSYVARRMTDR